MSGNDRQQPKKEKGIWIISKPGTRAGVVWDADKQKTLKIPKRPNANGKKKVN